MLSSFSMNYYKSLITGKLYIKICNYFVVFFKLKPRKKSEGYQIISSGYRVEHTGDPEGKHEESKKTLQK